MIIIDFDPRVSADQYFSVDVGDDVANIHLRWNERDGHWFADISSSNGEVPSVRIIEKSPLLGQRGGSVKLGGDFRVLAFNRDSEAITYDNLGSDWKIIFGTYQEWADYDNGAK